MFLVSGAAIPAVGVEDHKFPPEWKRYPDPTTEFEVLRLTDPGNSSRLPAYYQRAISKDGDSLLYSSDRTRIAPGVPHGLEKRAMPPTDPGGSSRSIHTHLAPGRP